MVSEVVRTSNQRIVGCELSTGNASSHGCFARIRGAIYLRESKSDLATARMVPGDRIAPRVRTRSVFPWWHDPCWTGTRQCGRSGGAGGGKWPNVRPFVLTG